MDRLDTLASTLSQITMYDIKSYYNQLRRRGADNLFRGQAKNVVLNVSEMEAKVREATNDEAWGASSTLMQDIATGTFNFQNFNEIMPCIYARFMEKEARQWREIYKALQLLEYLIKHGSERVVDDARSHIGTIKMLRNFHYIDDKGKDEGQNGALHSFAIHFHPRPYPCLFALPRSPPINQRPMIKLTPEYRSPQPLARNNRPPLGRRENPQRAAQGQGEQAQIHRDRERRHGVVLWRLVRQPVWGLRERGRFRGWRRWGQRQRELRPRWVTTTTLSAWFCRLCVCLPAQNTAEVVTLAMVAAAGEGGSSGGFRDDAPRRGFQEYDAGDDDDTAPVRRSSSVSQAQSRSQPSSQASTPRRGNTAAAAAALPPPKAKQPEVDLLGGFGDDEPIAAPATNKALPGFGGAPAPVVSLDGKALSLDIIEHQC
ncbi:ENTH-domain-containing protein [Athelia psychrophila]|uniref:ENTH-domain-containing protein n=1 Tax=Athelia psychrophila TaxID=1759441 RepID=A0A166BD93_9AGAM|nr:ENTH-domain-containing protein [Fibularhizoctonia sp. CBS 109695]